MSKRAPQKPGGRKGRKAAVSSVSARGSAASGASAEGARAFYVYCIGGRDELAPLFAGELPAGIESGAAIEVVEGESLAAVVSAVPLSDYGEEALAARVAEPAWTASRAMRHEAVVEHFASRATVVPLRFGTIYLKREGVERMLGEGREEFRGIVERLRGREEWGVNVYADRAALKEAAPSLSPRLRELAERAAAEPPGQAYLLRKKIDALRADEARLTARRVAAEVEDTLAAASDGAARLRLLKGEATERGDLVAKLAFLVERGGFGDFRAAAERLAERYAAAGFYIELTGPWPAYNFARTR